MEDSGVRRKVGWARTRFLKVGSQVVTWAAAAVLQQH